MTTNNTSAASAANVHHTPGPWTVDGSYIHGPNGKRFLAVAGDGEGQANARLIAAAPELFSTLHFVRKWMNLRTDRGDEFPSQLRVAIADAIAKAEGRA
jgi:hypothetical protein